MKDNRACKTWDVAPGYEEWDKVNCATCTCWTGNGCNDINKAKEENEHKFWAREMSNNRPVFLG